jgi:hypothetical protein
MTIETLVRLLVRRGDEEGVLSLVSPMLEAVNRQLTAVDEREQQLGEIADLLERLYGPERAFPNDGIQVRLGQQSIPGAVAGVLEAYHARFDEAATDEEWETLGWSIVNYGVDCALMAAAYARGVELDEESMGRLRQILSREYGDQPDHGLADVHDVVDRYLSEHTWSNPFRAFPIGARVVCETTTGLRVAGGTVAIKEGDDLEQIAFVVRTDDGDEFTVPSDLARLAMYGGGQ